VHQVLISTAYYPNYQTEMAVGGALFGNGRGGAAASKALVEFRAGKMTVSGSLVTADKRKGLIQVERGDDDLMHFKWKDRTSGTVEDDLIIFPDDIDFLRVDQCKTGRVYVLKFKSSSRRMFFWMQEPKEDKDEELCKKVNDSLNKPPPPGSSGGGGGADLGSLGSALGLSTRGGGVPDLSNLGDSGLRSLLSNMSQHQLAQLFGSSAPLRSGGLGGRSRNPASDSSSRTTSAASTPAQSSGPAATPAAPKKDSSSASAAASSAAAAASATPATGGSAPIGLSDLQSVLSGIKVPAGAEGLGASGSKEPAVDLSVGITGEVVKPLLDNPEFVAKMRELLPSGEQSEASDATAAIDSTVKSPQFKRALAMFSSGLQSGQLAPLIREFSLGDEAVAAAVSGSLEAFVKAVEKKGKAKKEGSAGDDEMGGLD